MAHILRDGAVSHPRRHAPFAAHPSRMEPTTAREATQAHRLATNRAAPLSLSGRPRAGTRRTMAHVQVQQRNGDWHEVRGTALKISGIGRYRIIITDDLASFRNMEVDDLK